jgi:flagellar biosynthesis protein FliP
MGLICLNLPNFEDFLSRKCFNTSSKTAITNYLPTFWTIILDSIQELIFLLLVAWLAFTTLMTSNFSMIFVNRSWTRTTLEVLKTPNPALWWVLGGGVVFLGIVLCTPLLRHLFRFSFLHPEDLAISLLFGIFSILWFEGLKLWQRKPLRIC